MIHTKAVVVPQKTHDVETHRTCDICGERIKEETFHEDRVRIECRTGDNYPECSSVVGTECDMCGECFRTKLVSWLEAQGVTMREVDHGF